MPINITDESKIPPLPFWNLFDRADINEGQDPAGTITRDTASFNTGNLGEGGDLFERINAKRKEDNEYTRGFLDDWIKYRNNPELMKAVKKAMEKNPRPNDPTGGGDYTPPKLRLSDFDIEDIKEANKAAENPSFKPNPNPEPPTNNEEFREDL